MNTDPTGSNDERLKNADMLRLVTDEYLLSSEIARSYYDGIVEGFNPFCDLPSGLEVRIADGELPNGYFASIDISNRYLSVRKALDKDPLKELSRIRSFIFQSLVDPIAIKRYDSRLDVPQAYMMLFSLLPHEFIHYQVISPLSRMVAFLLSNGRKSECGINGRTLTMGKDASVTVFNEIIANLSVADAFGTPWQRMTGEMLGYLSPDVATTVTRQAVVYASSVGYIPQNDIECQQALKTYCEFTTIGTQWSRLADAIWKARKAGIHPIDLGLSINQTINKAVTEKEWRLDKISYDQLTSWVNNIVDKEMIKPRFKPIDSRITWEQYFVANASNYEMLSRSAKEMVSNKT